MNSARTELGCFVGAGTDSLAVFSLLLDFIRDVFKRG